MNIFFFINVQYVWVKYVLFTLVNWSTYFLERLERSKPCYAHFKMGNSNKILFLCNPYENPNGRRKIEFSKNVKNLTSKKKKNDSKGLFASLSLFHRKLQKIQSKIWFLGRRPANIDRTQNKNTVKVSWVLCAKNYFSFLYSNNVDKNKKTKNTWRHYYNFFSMWPKSMI